MAEMYLQTLEEDILREIGQAMLGAVAQLLETFVGGEIRVHPPEIQTFSGADPAGEEKGLHADVMFKEGLTGRQHLFFPNKDAALFAALLLGQELPAEPSEEPGELEKSALQELTGMILGAYATSLAGFIGSTVAFDPPKLVYTSSTYQDFIILEEHWVVLRFVLDLKSTYTANFCQYIPYTFIQEVIAPLLPEQPPGPPIAEQVLPAGGAGPPQGAGEVLDALQQDALAEIGNISLGASATALAELLNRKVSITTPSVTLTTTREVRANYPIPCLAVTVNYVEGLTGHNVLIINQEDALAIVGAMMGLEPTERPLELGEMEVSGISEAMNQMMGSAATAMSDMFYRPINISPPRVEFKDLTSEKLDVAELEDEHPVVQIAFRLEVEGLLDSNLLQLMPLPFAQEIADYLLISVGTKAPPQEQVITQKEQVGAQEVEQGRAAADATDMADTLEIERLVAGLEGGDLPPQPTQVPAQARALPTAPFRPEDDYAYQRLDMIREIPIHIHALLGRTRLPLKDICAFLPGEIIVLDRYLGEPVEVYANDRLVARGEVVVVNGQFGFKIVDLIRA